MSNYDRNGISVGSRERAARGVATRTTTRARDHLAKKLGDKLPRTPSIPDDYYKMEGLTRALADSARPGDIAYARTMLRLDSGFDDFIAEHRHMIDAYEDGLPSSAAKSARFAAETLYRLADLHAELASAFETLPDHPLLPELRHQSTTPGDETADKIIDLRARQAAWQTKPFPKENANA